MSGCPEYLPGNDKGVIENSQENAEAKSGDQESREKGVQGGDVE